jgi:signal transduction histidine kinase
VNTTRPEVKILIVDDRPENLLALRAIFSNSGFILIEALSGQEAFEQAKLHDFACVLLDVQMPVMDGFETARALRRNPRTEDTPIIFITAIHRSEAYEEKGYIAGAVDYLFKPVNTEILVAKVNIFVDLYLKSEQIKQQNKLLEVALAKSKENEELKALLQARDEFLSMASHELKTPITPLNLQMQTFIELFESGKYLTVDKERLLRMLNTSQAQIERLSRLIYELVDVTRLASSKLELVLSETELNASVKKVLNDFEPEIRKSGAVITLKENAVVKGNWDGFRIEQIIINLLTNALKYGEKRPIVITVSKTDKAVLEISDEGLGIARENHERIFERYERAVSNSNYSGLGLGLFISKEIVALHHGSISVKSSPGSGSVFRVELPAL